MDYFKVQQNYLQEKLNIYYFDYIKYWCDNWKRVKMKKKIAEKNLKSYGFK